MQKPSGWLGDMLRMALLSQGIVALAVALFWWLSGEHSLSLLGGEFLVAGGGALCLATWTFSRLLRRPPVRYADNPLHTGPDRAQHWSITLLLVILTVMLLTCGGLLRAME